MELRLLLLPLPLPRLSLELFVLLDELLLDFDDFPCFDSSVLLEKVTEDS